MVRIVLSSLLDLINQLLSKRVGLKTLTLLAVFPEGLFCVLKQKVILKRS